MATSANVSALGKEIESLSDHLARLAETQSRTVSSVAAQLAFLLSLAVRKIAFGPNEWVMISDEGVIAATDVVHAASQQAAVAQTGEDAIALAGLVMDAIAALEQLQ